MNTQPEAKVAFLEAWPQIITECRQVLGSELHYQAMIYHCLRHAGKVPIGQIGMNVKMRIEDPTSEYFQKKEGTRAQGFRGLVEPIPDIVIFKRSIERDWRRRNYENSLRKMLMAIEVKASEREKDRLQPKELIEDIEKLTAHREEVRNLGGRVVSAMFIIDTATDEDEVPSSLDKVCNYAKSKDIALFYISPNKTREIGW